MKMKLWAVIFAVFNAGAAFCGGLSEGDLVNVQEISLEQAAGIEVSYRWEKVIIRQSGTDSLVIKEYMNKNNPRYYARTSNAGNRVVVERGNRPFGILINTFNVRAEVFIPASYTGAIIIKTTSGGIEAVDAFNCSKINIETSSGHIRVDHIVAGDITLRTSSCGIRAERLEGNMTVKTTSGSITVGRVNGDAAAETSSGRIQFDHITGSLRAAASSGDIRCGQVGGSAFAEATSGSVDLGMVNGNITAKTASGRIRCAAGEHTEAISLASSSGGVALELPPNFSAHFSSRTSSGALSTPFSGTLFSPVSDHKSVQGTTGGDNPTKNITIQTTSGSIRVNWSQ